MSCGKEWFATFASVVCFQKSLDSFHSCVFFSLLLLNWKQVLPVWVFGSLVKMRNFSWLHLSWPGRHAFS